MDQLYDFANELGITVIQAIYSRYVIDLNRSPNSTPLYDDAERFQTALVPTKTFALRDIYVDGLPTVAAINDRRQHYFWPYYQQIDTLLDELKNDFGQVLLLDAHSIKRQVASISEQAFPCMILGNRDHTTAHQDLIHCALRNLRVNEKYQVTDNTPFKGGHITQYFAKPAAGIHTLQLEMSQDIYMDEASIVYDAAKAQAVREILRGMFLKLATSLKELA